MKKIIYYSEGRRSLRFFIDGKDFHFKNGIYKGTAADRKVLAKSGHTLYDEKGNKLTSEATDDNGKRLQEGTGI